MTDARRILVRLPNWLGDALMARPLLHALARRHPRAERWAVGPASIVELVGFDEVETSAGRVRVFDHAEWMPPLQGTRRDVVSRLRRWRPDLALVLPPSFSSAWLAWRAGARERIGFAHEGRSILLTRALRRPPRGDRHLSDEYLALLGGDASLAGLPPLGLIAPAMDRARDLCAELALGDRPLALLGPGAIYGPAKRWDAARYAELARRLVARGCAVLVCGAPSEVETCEHIARAAGVRSVAGTTDLLTQAGLCARAAVVVCNDSGLAHLAAAVGAPTVALFGSTSSAWTAPLGPRVRIVQHAPVCSPCFQRTCRIGYPCLTAITVDEVERTCEAMLEAHAA